MLVLKLSNLSQRFLKKQKRTASDTLQKRSCMWHPANFSICFEILAGPVWTNKVLWILTVTICMHCYATRMSINNPQQTFFWLSGFDNNAIKCNTICEFYKFADITKFSNYENFSIWFEIFRYLIKLQQGKLFSMNHYIWAEQVTTFNFNTV